MYSWTYTLDVCPAPSIRGCEIHGRFRISQAWLADFYRRVKYLGFKRFNDLPSPKYEWRDEQRV